MRRTVAKGGSSCRIPSKHALLHVNYILVTHVFIQRRAGFLDLAGAVASMQHDPPAGALAGHATAVGERLHDGHSLFQAITAGPLHLAVDVEHRGSVDEQRITSAKLDIVRRRT